ncbi:MAG TPA: glycogen debranching protein GlgX [Vicinamibacterales bacterium]|nr:glycogen debranching protein GlgX [Vicinamibacterales bacterium]
MAVASCHAVKPSSAASEQLDELERLLSLCEVQSVRSGSPLPLGAHFRGDGVNFALFSRHATGVRLDLFDRLDADAPARTIILDAVRNKTGDIWHVWLEGIPPGQLYGFRVAGPYAPEDGHRFNPNALLIDPCARAIARQMRVDASTSAVNDAASAPKCVVPHEDFNWQGDQPLRLPWTSTIVYELHVRGYTIDPGSGVQCPGTYRGLTDKIPYLKGLGVTTVELMPVQEFDEADLHRSNPNTGEPLRNFWGYDPISFFSPNGSYASTRDSGAQVLEFKEMVRTFHREGLEVILDVVFNHTGEGDELGPTLSFRGIDNAIYYWLADDKRHYRDFTGTGQTINASHPIVRDLILDALRYWVIEMHVDGFRFDLASVLGRDAHGSVLADAPLLERIAEDPILRDAKLIAEAWDVAGAYQVGSFSQRRWAEWNGHFRDDVRRFWRGDPGMIGRFASRICGSADLYAASGKGPESSINFVSCHDGLTLNDLVSYSRKHNDANGEQNRDGADENYSANYGVEGASSVEAVEIARERQIKNFLLTLAISRGVPMLLAGDEFRRTQHGNNNAYCQDNPTSWIDWSLAQKHRELLRFVQQLFAFRRAHPVLRREAFYTDADIEWFDSHGRTPDWFAEDARRLACWIHGGKEPDLYLMFNADGAPASFVIPVVTDGRWRLAIDTALQSTSTADNCDNERVVTGAEYAVVARGSAVLEFARGDGSARDTGAAASCPSADAATNTAAATRAVTSVI